MGAVGLFVASSLIWRSNFSQIVACRIAWSLAVLTIFLIVSCLLAEHNQDAWLGLANFVPFFWLFVALKELIKRPEQLKHLSWSLILPSLPIASLGFAQIYLSWDTPPLLESILGWELVPQGVPAGRMSSVFIYTNFLAIYLAIAFILALGLWLDTWQRWQRQPRTVKKSSRFWVLLLLTIILLGDISALILTSSRNAWGLVAIGFLIYALLMGWHWLVWGVMGAATAILWASFAPNLGGTQLRKVVPAFIWLRLSDRLYERPVETLRITQWEFCWDLIQQRPIFGWGLRNFSPLYEAQMNYWFGHPHNLFLMLGAETGLIPTAMLVGIVGYISYRAIIWLQRYTKVAKSIVESDFGLIYSSYLIVFLCCILFNFLDVTIFEFRINTIIWIVLAAIAGIATKNEQLG
ncbi:MAG: O-antigen ligase family protein [Cyanobacteria bacterium P01_G01_bin.19]